MAAVVLTDKYVKALKPAPDGQRTTVADAGLPGLSLRVTDRGIKSFSYRYRFAGQQRRTTLGTYPATSLAEARDKVRTIIDGVQHGHDPEGTNTIQAPAVRTVNDVAEQFFRLYLRTRDRRTADEIERMIRRDLLTALGRRDIRSITRRDIRDVVTGVADRARATAERYERTRAKVEGRESNASVWQQAGASANRVHANIKKLFNWAIEEQFVDVNPAKFGAIVEERARDRTLSDDEIRAVWDACMRVHPVFGRVVRLLLLTGQRLSEVAEMQFSELDMDSGEWRLPGSRTKNRRDHIVPLPQAALDVIAEQGRLKDCPHIFTINGRAPASVGDRWSQALRGKCGFDVPFRLHDLRHTAASGMAELGIDPHVIEAVLNHKSGIVSGIAGRYNSYSYLKEKRAALAAWADHIAEVVSQTP